jgi:hypothetical protein
LLSLKYYTYKVPELKAIGFFVSRHTQLIRILETRSELKRPSGSAKRQDWENYCTHTFNFLQINPSYFSLLSTENIQATNVSLRTVSDNSANNGGMKGNVISSQVNCSSGMNSLGQFATTNAFSIPMVQAAQSASVSLPFQQNTAQSVSLSVPAVTQPSSYPAQTIEYFNGVECIDIVRYPNGLPANLLYAYQQKSQYEGYPSRLRYKQVKIKQEKREPNQMAQADTPQTPFESHIVNSLRQMGCTDVQEIMSSLRYVQRQNPTIGGDSLVDTTLMHIVQQREERDEAKKMDEARIQSEQILLVERTDKPQDIAYTNDEMLGFGGSKSIQFPKSHLLQSQKVKILFHTIVRMNGDDGIIRELLEIENKANKFYGDKLPEPFFRHILCNKIERWHDDSLGQKTVLSDDGLSDLIDKMKKEFHVIQNSIYSLSEQDETLQVPRLFISARANAIAKGLISHQPDDVIMIDDD